MMTPTPHENDSSFLPSSVVTAAPHNVSDSFTAATCQQDVSDHFQVNDGVIRFGTKQAGDVSLTLGLRHTGNMPDNKNPSFSVRDFGDFQTAFVASLFINQLIIVYFCLLIYWNMFYSSLHKLLKFLLCIPSRKKKRSTHKLIYLAIKVL